MNNAIVRKISASEQLQELFCQAQADKTPVSLYRKPQLGGIILDFSEWKDIEVFDVDNLMIIVPPGILLKDLNAVAATKGLRFMPADTSALECLSVGEWAYRGCPNPSVWKYGAGKHFLLGSSYVLPNGDMTAVGGKCIKNVTGYDFTRFFTGAYADLAVGVRYIIKLMPQPACRYRYDVNVGSLSAATQLISALQVRSVPPAWLFWADETAGRKLFGQSQQGQRILFELDGNETEVRDYQDFVDSILAASHIQQVPAANIPDMSYLESSSDGFWLLDEFKIPYSAIESFADRFAKLLADYGWHGGMFGQLVDGKIHIYLETVDSRIKTFIAALTAEACSLGGAASGKYARLYETAAQDKLAALEMAFKEKIDPQLIFNRREVSQ